MSDTTSQQKREDEQVIITDLEPQQKLSVYGRRGARFIHSKLSAAFFQGARICFILLMSLLVASLLFQPPDLITDVGQPTRSVNSQPAIDDMSEHNGVTYIATQDQAVAAYRSRDGLLLWRHHEDGLVISITATDQAVYCLLSTGGYGRVMALFPANGTSVWEQKIPVLGAIRMRLADGILFLHSSRGMIYAVSSESGRILWNAPILAGLPPDEFVSVEDGYVSIVSPQFDYHILRASDGKLIYRYNSSFIAPQSTLYPTIQDDIIYISDTYTVQARNISNGILLWKYSYTGLYWYPVIQNGIVLARGMGNALLAFRGQDGKLLWKYASNAPIIFPVISNGTVYLQLSGYQAIALRESDGATLWRVKLPPPTGYDVPDPNSITPPLIDNNTLYLNIIIPFATVYALRASDGYLLWNQVLSDTVFRYAPQTGGGIIYLSRDDYSINAFSESTGQSLWNFNSIVPLIWYPVVDNGLMFVRTIEGIS